MNIGERIFELRKAKNLSQEEIAYKLGVSRQTISKWETNQSQPDFDKIVPLCELFDISTDELLKGQKSKKVETKSNQKALVISVSVFLYFIGVCWVILASEFLDLSEGIFVPIFLVICAIATSILVYYFVSNPSEEKKKEPKNPLDAIISLLFTIIYLLVSFLTMRWDITWLIWIVYALVCEIIKLLRGGNIDE